MSYHELAKRSVWILDVDDCLYPIDNIKNPDQPGLHHRVKDAITSNWNVHASPSLKAAFARHIQNTASQFPEALQIDPMNLQAQDLKIFFPYLLTAIKEADPSNFREWIDRFYGDYYDDCLAPDPILAEALRTARAAGIRVLLYTNGPSHPDKGQDSHVQKVLRALEIDEAMIEALRHETQDLIISENEGFAKPHPTSMQNFIKRFGISPHDALMGEDSVPNIVTAHKFGILPLWTWTSDKPPSLNDVAAAHSIGAFRVRHTGEALLKIAQARLLMFQPLPTPAP